MNRLIVYGDLHGCLDEFSNLRKKIDPSKNDIEVCVGDLITKGPKSIEVLQYLMKNNIVSVLGNHEDKIIRYLRHQEEKTINNIILAQDEQNIADSLSTSNIKYLKALPLFLRYKNIIVVHGGLQNSMDLNNLSKREQEKIIRLRYLDMDGHFIPFGKESRESVFWADKYDGNQGFVIYGHQYFNEPKINRYSLGIDTGCAYGNKLSAAIFNLNEPFAYEIISVQSL